MDPRLARFRKASAQLGLKKFPKPLISLAVDYARSRLAEGATRTLISEELGIVTLTLRRWLKDSSPEHASHFVRVSVKDGSTHSLSLVGPNGWRVDGLQLVDIPVLLRALS